jgi:hypothetical protein
MTELFASVNLFASVTDAGAAFSLLISLLAEWLSFTGCLSRDDERRDSTKLSTLERRDGGSWEKDVERRSAMEYRGRRLER